MPVDYKYILFNIKNDKLSIFCILTHRYEQEYGIWTVSDNDRKLIKLDISLIYVVILWPNGWLVC